MYLWEPTSQECNYYDDDKTDTTEPEPSIETASTSTSHGQAVKIYGGVIDWLQIQDEACPHSMRSDQLYVQRELRVIIHF